MIEFFLIKESCDVIISSEARTPTEYFLAIGDDSNWRRHEEKT